jgi:hypothetical protein
MTVQNPPVPEIAVYCTPTAWFSSATVTNVQPFTVALDASPAAAEVAAELADAPPPPESATADCPAPTAAAVVPAPAEEDVPLLHPASRQVITAATATPASRDFVDIATPRECVLTLATQSSPDR